MRGPHFARRPGTARGATRGAERLAVMSTFHGSPPTHLTLAALAAVGVRHLFTTRHFGNLGTSASPGGPFGGAPGRHLRQLLDVEPAAVRFARQVHGTTCLAADGLGSGLVGEADALTTATPGVPLAVFTADCLAVVLVDPAGPALAVAHAGWRGTVAGLLGRVVATLVRECGARPERLVAAIGPSIGPCCYEVDEPVVGPLRAAFPDRWARWVRAQAPGRWMLDLWQANADQLAAAGIRPDAIANPRLCTACRRDLFFSYRQEGGGLRLAAVALLG